MVLCAPCVKEHIYVVKSLAFSPNSKVVATIDRNFPYTAISPITWDADTGEELQMFVGHTDIVMFVAFSPDGKNIATSSRDGTTRIWDTDSGKELMKFPGNRYDITASVVFSPDGMRSLSSTISARSFSMRVACSDTTRFQFIDKVYSFFPVGKRAILEKMNEMP